MADIHVPFHITASLKHGRLTLRWSTGPTHPLAAINGWPAAPEFGDCLIQSRIRMANRPLARPSIGMGWTK